jgi:mycothiol synthase
MTSDRLTLRAPSLDDLEPVFELLVARDMTDYGTPDVTMEDLRAEWTAGSFDATLVQDASGGIVGYASLHRPGSMGFVHPEHEGQGVGTQLVTWAQRRERALHRPHHGQAAAASNRRARELFEAFGYTYLRSYSRLVRALDASEAERIPAWVHVRSPVPDSDAAALHALDALSFAANPDYHPAPLEEFVQEHLRAHDHAPELSLMAFDGETLIGFLLARRWREDAVGFIDLLAVHPEARGRGIGSGLLHTAFARFAADGLREAQLGVASDNPRALAIYERAGMTPRFVVDAFHRPIGPAA